MLNRQRMASELDSSHRLYDRKNHRVLDPQPLPRHCHALGVVAWGIHAVINTPVDAIPDLSENQVIVFTDWMGRSPREIEDQITYPLSVNLQGLAGVKAVRSSSEFNFSMINVIFDDNVDFYFARERVSERLAWPTPSCRRASSPTWPPTPRPWGRSSGTRSRARARTSAGFARSRISRTIWLKSVEGVADVASVGGLPIEYQIDVDPHKLRAYNITLGELYSAVARANSSVGGKVIQKGGAEKIVRGVGWINRQSDIEQIVVKSDATNGTPICVGKLARWARRRVPPQRAGKKRLRSRRRGGHDAPRREPAGSHQADQAKIVEFSRACPRASASCPFTTARG